MTKDELRIHYQSLRRDLTEANYLHFNRMICDLFFSAIDLSFVRVIHTFLPMSMKREPDMWLILDRLRREFPHIQLSVPRVNPVTHQLEHFNFEGLHQIRENKWGIPEPLQGVPTRIEKIDVVLVPLLAADRHGNRVGYGKGYYDSFLATTRIDCQKTGISFFPPAEDIEGIEPHDIKLNSLICPDQYWQF